MVTVNKSKHLDHRIFTLWQESDNFGNPAARPQGILKVLDKDKTGRILVSFQYNPSFIQKVKSIKGHRWHPVEKHWSFPDTDGILEKILKSFEGEEIHLDQSLQSQLSKHVIARSESTKQSQENPSLAKRGEGRFSDKKLFKTPFDDLKRELLSRKYSYKTVKGYLL